MKVLTLSIPNESFSRNVSYIKYLQFQYFKYQKADSEFRVIPDGYIILQTYQILHRIIQGNDLEDVKDMTYQESRLWPSRCQGYDLVDVKAMT